MTLYDIPLIFDLSTIIGIFALAQAACLMVYLSIFHYKQSAYWCLSGLLLSIFIALGHDVLLHSKLSLLLPQMIGFGPFSTYLSGPLIWLLAVKLTEPDKPFKAIHALHFLPFLLHFASRMGKYFGGSEGKLQFIIDYYQSNNGEIAIMTREFNLDVLGGLIYFYGHRFTYIALALWVLYRYKHSFVHALKARSQFYDVIKWGLIIYCVTWSIIQFGGFIPFSAPNILASQLALHSLGLSGAVLALAIILLRHNSEQIFSSKSTQKYQQSALEKSTAQQLIAQIKQQVEDKQGFCDEQLTLQRLSEQLGISTQLISQAINGELNISFNDYLNNLRLAHVKKALSQPENLKSDIQQLAINSGFNSKATFYRVFKEKVGMTPSAYRKAQSKLDSIN